MSLLNQYSSQIGSKDVVGSVALWFKDFCLVAEAIALSFGSVHVHCNSMRICRFGQDQSMERPLLQARNDVKSQES